MNQFISFRLAQWNVSEKPSLANHRYFDTKIFNVDKPVTENHDATAAEYETYLEDLSSVKIKINTKVQN